MNLFIALIVTLLIGVAVLISVPAARLAALIRSLGPLVLGAVIVVLLMTGRFGFALLLAPVLYTWWQRNRGVGTFGGTSTGGQTGRSSVRSAALEMELDHTTGAMNGVVLTGQFEGRELDELNQDELMDLLREVESDGESVALLDAYLDRRIPGWREDADFEPGAGESASTSAGPMGEEEAYEILGLAPGASAQEISSAHRRLMGALHPDRGGSTFLAAKINEAKDILLKRHS